MRNPTVTVVEKLTRALKVPASRLLEKVLERSSERYEEGGFREATGFLGSWKRVSVAGEVATAVYALGALVSLTTTVMPQLGFVAVPLAYTTDNESAASPESLLKRALGQ